MTNEIVAYCKLFKYEEFLPFFKANKIDNIEKFLSDDKANEKLAINSNMDLVKCLNFVNSLRSYHQRRIKTKDRVNVNLYKNTSYFMSSEHWWIIMGNNWDNIPFDSLPNARPDYKYAINWRRVLSKDDPIFFIDYNGEFTMGGFNFHEEKYPISWTNVLNNINATDEMLLNLELNSLLVDIRRIIMEELQQAYINMVPELVYHQISGTFTFIFNVAQKNYQRCYLLRHKDFFRKKNKNNFDVIMHSNVGDIGKFLKLKFRYGKQSVHQSKINKLVKKNKIFG